MEQHNETIKILITDDHWLFRESLRAVLQTKHGLVVVGEAENGEVAVRKTNELHPDVVLMDVRMPVLGGIEATRRIKAARPQTIIIALSNHSDDRYIHEMQAAGAAAYLTKSVSPRELEQAIRHAFNAAGAAGVAGQQEPA